MTDWMMESTEHDLRGILGTFLSSRTSSAKELARRIGCEPRTAEGFRAGRYWPQAKHWASLVGTFGKDITEAVFHPEETVARLEREAADLEAQLREKRALAREMASNLPRASRSFAPLQERAAVDPLDPN